MEANNINNTNQQRLKKQQTTKNRNSLKNKRKKPAFEEEKALKRTKALNYLALILSSCFILLVCLSFVSDRNLHKVWFSFFLVLAGIYMLVRAVFFHLDSNCLIGLIFCGFAVISGFDFFYGFWLVSALYFLWLGISFLVVYLIFRQNIYLILFALSVGEVLLLVINKLFLNIFIFALFQAIYIMTVFIIFISVTKIKKEKKGAVSNN